MAARRAKALPITREIHGDDVIYRLRGRKITKRSEIKRLDALVIPPAWNDVQIARSPSAKVLARGVDAAGRTQAIYHPSFRQRQDQRKYDRMMRFARALPRLRSRVERDLRRRRLNRDRVTACVVRLIDMQFFRVGNVEYATRHKSYGVTTLREEHLSTTASAVDFDFVGKSGKRQHRRVRDPRVARLVSQLMELPGPEVFRFFDEDDILHRLRSRHVNSYIKRHMGEEFTAKDFRTWGGTVLVASALLSLDPTELGSVRQRTVAMRDAIKLAAERLGNTAAVTRSSYVDPRALEAVDYPETLASVRRARLGPARYLSREEQRTIKLLRTITSARPKRG